MLIPNIDKRRQVIAWREKHGLAIPSFAAPAQAHAGLGGAAAEQTSKPAALCSCHSKQPLQVFCITCDKAICMNCAVDYKRCKPHNTRPIAVIITSVRDAHTAWLQLCDGRPQQLQAETNRVTEAANAAIELFTRQIREEETKLKLELQRDRLVNLERTVQQQAQLLADVQIAAASPEAAVAGSEACRCLRTAETQGSQMPGQNRGGRFKAVAGVGAERGRTMRLGWIERDGSGDEWVDEEDVPLGGFAPPPRPRPLKKQGKY